jgi:hypothetical protein
MAKTKDFNILLEKVNTTSNLKDFAMVSNYNMYVQQIENVCKTQKGENIDSYFGANLFTYLFDRQNNRYLIETSVSNAITSSIPSISKATAKMIYSDDNVMRFKIDFYIFDGIKSQSSTCTIEVRI